MTAVTPQQGGYARLQSQGEFKHLGKEEITTIQSMVAEDCNNLLRKADEVLA